MYSLHLKIDGLPKTTNTLAYKNRWKRIEEKNKWLFKVSLALKIDDQPETPLKKANIKCTRFSSMSPDFDGLVSSFKYVIDALVELDILEDDNRGVLVDPKYEWIKAKPKQGFITVELDEC